MTAHEYLKSLPYLPYSVNGKENGGRPTNSDLRRWLENRSVIINDEKPGWKDEVKPPVNQLVFFPKGHKVTML